MLDELKLKSIVQKAIRQPNRRKWYKKKQMVRWKNKGHDKKLLELEIEINLTDFVYKIIIIIKKTYSASLMGSVIARKAQLARMVSITR
jgi:hypothetical protein